MNGNQSGANIKRRPKDSAAAKDLAVEVHEKVTEAITFAEESLRREQRLKDAGRHGSPIRRNR